VQAQNRELNRELKKLLAKNATILKHSKEQPLANKIDELV